MSLKIISIPLSRLTEEDPGCNEEFLKNILINVPQMGKENPTHFIFNTHLTLVNDVNVTKLQILNVVLQMSKNNNYQLLQVLKCK